MNLLQILCVLSINLSVLSIQRMSSKSLILIPGLPDFVSSMSKNLLSGALSLFLEEKKFSFEFEYKENVLKPKGFLKTL